MAVSLPAYAALDCATPPTCAELGYKQTETDCAGKFMLKCPFSDEDFFCGGEIASCSDLGYRLHLVPHFVSLEAQQNIVLVTVPIINVLRAQLTLNAKMQDIQQLRVCLDVQ